MKAFKLSESLFKSVRCGYLYANGKLVLVHETRHPKAGTVSWVTIHDTGLHCDFIGRIVYHRRGMIRLALTAQNIKAKECKPENGSEATQKANIAVGYINYQLGPDAYYDAVHISLMPGLISADITYQPENVWTDPQHGTWADYRIAA